MAPAVLAPPLAVFAVEVPVEFALPLTPPLAVSPVAEPPLAGVETGAWP